MYHYGKYHENDHHPLVMIISFISFSLKKNNKIKIVGLRIDIMGQILRG